MQAKSAAAVIAMVLASQIAIAQAKPTVPPVISAPQAPMATVTGIQGGRNVSFAGGADTVMQGLIVALLGSSNVEHETTKEQWDELLKKEHLRVRFARPQVLATDVEGEKSYKTSEILVAVSPTHLANRLLIRCGDKYHAFGKYDGHIAVLLKDRFLPR